MLFREISAHKYGVCGECSVRTLKQVVYIVTAAAAMFVLFRRQHKCFALRSAFHLNGNQVRCGVWRVIACYFGCAESGRVQYERCVGQCRYAV